MSIFEDNAQTTRRLLGTDIKIDGTRIVATDDGDIALDGGRDCLASNLQDLIDSSPFDKVRHPEWGIALEDYVSERLTDEKATELIQRVEAGLKADTRVKNIISIQVSPDDEIPRKFYLEVEIEPVDGQPYLNLVWPFDMEV